MHPLRFGCIILCLWNLIGFILLPINKDMAIVALMGGFMPLMAFICLFIEVCRSISEYMKRTTEVEPIEEQLLSNKDENEDENATHMGI